MRFWIRSEVLDQIMRILDQIMMIMRCESRQFQFMGERLHYVSKGPIKVSLNNQDYDHDHDCNHGRLKENVMRNLQACIFSFWFIFLHTILQKLV